MAYTSFAELEALRKKLDRKRRELDEQEAALAKVEQMLREEMAEDSSNLPQLPIIAPLPTATGFSDAVRIAVNAVGHNEFAVHDIEKYLETHGFELPQTDPRARIAMVLQSMREKKSILRTHEGKGRNPSKYRMNK